MKKIVLLMLLFASFAFSKIIIIDNNKVDFYEDIVKERKGEKRTFFYDEYFLHKCKLHGNYKSFKVLGMSSRKGNISHVMLRCKKTI